MNRLSSRRAVLSAVVATVLLGLTWEPSRTAGAADEKRMIGGVEEVLLLPWGLTVRARVDTGAAISSVDARAIEVRGEEGARTVHFTLVGDDERQLPVTLPLAGHRLVRTPGGQSRRRPVVLIEICVAGVRTMTEVTLNDRSRLRHRVLLGRNLLEGRFVVDVARALTAPPACPSAP